MKMIAILAVVVFVAAFVVGCSGTTTPARPAEGPKAPPDTGFSEPMTYKNLSVYLYYGPDQIADKDIMTLPEALEKKQAVVVETGNVNNLSIENNSNVKIYIHSGVIVKGGQQDRMLKDDCIIKPGEKMSISSFCVEHGRWTARGNEDAGSFASGKSNIASSEMKIAAREKTDQGQVWAEVDRTQKKLSDSAGKDVRSDKSASSLQLTLENKDVQASADDYRKAMADALKGKKHVIGYAFAINGKINSVDIFGSELLFQKLWPQMLDAIAIEAVAKAEKGREYAAPKANEVQAFLETSRKAKADEQKVGNNAVLNSRVTNGMSNFQSYDTTTTRPASVRESVINKEK